MKQLTSYRFRFNLGKVCLLVFIMLVVIVPQNSSAVTSTTWSRVKVNGYYSSGNGIAIDGNGHLWMVETDRVTTPVLRYYVRLYKSTDGGNTWALETEFSSTTYGYSDTDIAIDIYTNRVYVVYNYWDTNIDYGIELFYYSSSTNYGWTVILDSPNYNERYPSIAVDFEYGSSNYVYVAFERQITSIDTDMYVMRSTDDGVSFLTWDTAGVNYVYYNPRPTTVYDLNVYTGIDIAIGESSNVYVSYAWGADSPTNIYLEWGLRSASGFENSKQITSGKGNQYKTTSIAVSRHASYSDYIQIVYDSKSLISSSWNIGGAYSKDGGTTWSFNSNCIACSNYDENYPNLSTIGMQTSGNTIGDFFVGYLTLTANWHIAVSRSSYTNMGYWAIYSPMSGYSIYPGIAKRGMGITVQPGPNGGYTPIIAFRGYVSSYVAGDLLTLATPILVPYPTSDPWDGIYYTTDTTPYLEWNSVIGGVSYQLQVAGSSSFSDIQYDYTTADTAKTVSALSDGFYYWRVRAKDHDGNNGPWSGAPYFEVDTTGPTVPVQNLKYSGWITNDYTPTLSWAAVGQAITYEIQVSPLSNFSTIIYSGIDQVQVSGQYTRYHNVILPLTTGTNGTIYYWRVRARDDRGNWGPYSSYAFFYLDRVPPGQPTLISPNYNQTLATESISFDWSDSTDIPYLYKIWLSLNSDMSGANLSFTSSSNITLTPGDGTWYWQVTARDAAYNWGTNSTISRFTKDTTGPLSPILKSPVDIGLINDTTPNLSWNSAGDAVKYYVQVDTDSNFVSPMVDANTTGTSYTTSTLAEGTYYWRVKAEDNLGNPGAWTAARNFTVDTTAPKTPVLINPLTGTTSNNQNPDLVWSAVTGASDYHVQVYNVISTFVDASVTGTTYSVVDPLPDNTYYWRVRAKDAASNWSPWSVSLSFTVDITDPVAPLLSSPADGSSGANTGPTLKWNAVTDATLYQVVMDNNNDFTSTLYNQITESTSLATSGLGNGIYYWKVRSTDAAGNTGAWSLVWSLTIDTNVISETSFLVSSSPTTSSDVTRATSETTPPASSSLTTSSDITTTNTQDSSLPAPSILIYLVSFLGALVIIRHHKE